MRVELKGGGFGEQAYELVLLLFVNVTNARDLLQQLKTGALEVAFIDPSLVCQNTRRHLSFEMTYRALLSINEDSWPSSSLVCRQSCSLR